MRQLLAILVVLSLLITPLGVAAEEPPIAPAEGEAIAEEEAPVEEALVPEEEVAPVEEEAPAEEAPADAPTAAPSPTPVAKPTGTPAGCVPMNIDSSVYLIKLVVEISSTEEALESFGNLSVELNKDKDWPSKRPARDKVSAAARTTREAAQKLKAFQPGPAELKPLYTAAMKLADDVIYFANEWAAAMDEINKTGRVTSAAVSRVGNATERAGILIASIKSLNAEMDKVDSLYCH